MGYSISNENFRRRKTRIIQYYIYNVKKKKSFFKQKQKQRNKYNPKLKKTQYRYAPKTNKLIVCNSDKNVLFYEMVGDRTQKSAVFQKLLAGHTDEIVDMKFLPNQSEILAVATNSEQLRLFNIVERTTTILNGHTDTILGIGNIFSKQNKKKKKKMKLEKRKC